MDSVTTYHIMYKDIPVADVSADEKNLVRSIKKFVPDSPMQPLWGDFSKASPQAMTARFYTFLKGRCYDDARADLPEILRQAGMKSNNPYEWVRVCHGVTYEDFFWVKLEGEDISWNDVRVR